MKSWGFLPYIQCIRMLLLKYQIQLLEFFFIFFIIRVDPFDLWVSKSYPTQKKYQKNSPFFLLQIRMQNGTRKLVVEVLLSHVVLLGHSSVQCAVCWFTVCVQFACLWPVAKPLHTMKYPLLTRRKTRRETEKV